MLEKAKKKSRCAKRKEGEKMVQSVRMCQLQKKIN